jgi:hypothetical protein
MEKSKAKAAVTLPKKGSRAVSGLTAAEISAGFSKSASPFITEDEETSLNKGCRDISKSTVSTPPTSVVNTPEPTTNGPGRASLSRIAKKKLPAYLVETVSEADASLSDFLVSRDQSDAVSDSQSATDCQETEDSTAEEDEYVISPAAKRVRLNKRNPLTYCKFISYSHGTLILIDQASPEDSLGEENSGDKTTSTKAKKSVKNKGADSQYTDPFAYKIGIDETLKPVCNIEDIFSDITAKGRKMGLDDAINHLQGRKLKIATMCSGTESPLLAIQLVCDSKLVTLISQVKLLTACSFEEAGSKV